MSIFTVDIVLQFMFTRGPCAVAVNSACKAQPVEPEPFLDIHKPGNRDSSVE